MANEPWYEFIKDLKSLEQGDLIFECPIIVPPKITFKAGDTIQVKAKVYNVIIMSQSCDLEQDKIKSVLLCPFISLSELGKLNNIYLEDNGKELLRRGYVVHKHILDKCTLEGYVSDYLVVDFKNIYSLHIDNLKQLISNKKQRIRLKSPYKEHLSQAFARYFMRVGLPSDIPKFSDSIFED